ncbi:MAG: hypothetical protein IPK26_31210 [Planctomycetes bacterium]|nr:hypothetical protein [Planctomycetota bacterium]
MNGALALLLGAVLAAPQGGEPLFVRKLLPAADGQPARATVSANTRSVDCHEALQELGNAMGWNVLLDSRPLENDLRIGHVDLAFTDQDPRVIGQLIAVAAGADTVFDDGNEARGVRPTLHVVRRPDGATESGRQRLRALAAQWYRSFLTDELQNEPLVADEAMAVRFSLGSMLIDNGDLESAIRYFTQVWDNRPHDSVPAAVLRVAECHLDLARNSRDRERAREQWGKAEEWARRVLENFPSADEVTRATIVLGKALLGLATTEATPEAMKKRCDACRTELSARVMRLLDTVEMLDVWLLIGETQFRLGWPTRAYETMLTLRESPNFGDLGEQQFLDYHFLLGYGALGSDKPELAMQALEWFLINGRTDPRRGMAYVLLTKAYMAQNRHVQARAAAVEARDRHMADLDETWRREALKLWARTALALGDKESAFAELEVLVHRVDDPELTLFVVDELLVDRQWQRAISVARPLVGHEGGQGDRARFQTIKALYEQAVAQKNLAEFPAAAVALAPKILDPKLRAATAELLGDAWTQLGKLEYAADAYRGILR